MLSVGLGPEVGDQLVAAEPVLASGGEEGEKGKSLALGGRARDRSAVVLDGQPAERPEFEHQPAARPEVRHRAHLSRF